MKSVINNVAVIGLGAMGHAFAANLLKKAFTVTVWNRSADKGRDLVDSGATLAENPQQAVSDCDAILLMLTDGATTLEIVEQILPACKHQAIVVQMGTIGVEATHQLEKLLATQRPDLRLLDAPVSGTKKPAELAQITILAAGDPSLAPEIAPVFSAISKGTHWLGEVGAGSAMKLVVNSWLIGLVQSLAESQVLADKFGFTPDEFWSVLEGGPLAVPYAKLKLEAISQQQFEPQMQLKWAHKDASLVTQAGNRAQMPNMLQIEQLWQQAIDAGYGDNDLSVIAKYLAEQ